MTSSSLTTLVLDYGGVLTNPLLETFQHFCTAVGVEPAELGAAMGAYQAEHGEGPMAALEVAAVTEAEMIERLLVHLPEGRRDMLQGRPFGQWWFEGRRIDPAVTSAVAAYRDRGLRTALLTNNVKEWEQRWRAQFDVDSLFEVVVNSCHEGVRKPDPEIYRRLLDRLGVAAGDCLVVDDLADNCEAARALGFEAILWVDAATTLPQIDARLGLVPATGEGGGTPA